MKKKLLPLMLVIIGAFSFVACSKDKGSRNNNNNNNQCYYSGQQYICNNNNYQGQYPVGQYPQVPGQYPQVPGQYPQCQSNEGLFRNYQTGQVACCQRDMYGQAIPQTCH